MSETKSRQYREGTVQIRLNKRSAAEREIARQLEARGVQFKTQFHIDGVPYLYDFYFPSMNLIIEYQGDYWHAHPAKYPSGAMLRIQNVGLVLVDNIWARDEAKRKAAVENGFTIAYVWERDYKAQGMTAVECLLK